MPVIQATRKPTTLSCIRWEGDNLREVLEFTGKHFKFDKWFTSFEAYEAHVRSEGNIFKVFTRNGVTEAVVGDYIIRGVEGEHYPCKPDIFDEIYDTSGRVFVPMADASTHELAARLEKCKGYEPYMLNWICVSYKECGISRIPVYECYHPDHTVFYASSELQQAVDAFSNYPYLG